MIKVIVKNNENLEDALRRFKRKVFKNGNLGEIRRRKFYIKPGIKKKIKSAIARKKNKKNRFKR